MDIKFCSLSSISFLPALASNAKKKRKTLHIEKKKKKNKCQSHAEVKARLLQAVWGEKQKSYILQKKMFNYTLQTPEFILLFSEIEGNKLENCDKKTLGKKTPLHLGPWAPTIGAVCKLEENSNSSMAIGDKKGDGILS